MTHKPRDARSSCAMQLSRDSALFPAFAWFFFFSCFPPAPQLKPLWDPKSFDPHRSVRAPSVGQRASGLLRVPAKGGNRRTAIPADPGNHAALLSSCFLAGGGVSTCVARGWFNPRPEPRGAFPRMRQPEPRPAQDLFARHPVPVLPPVNSRSVAAAIQAKPTVSCAVSPS